jgi:soluble lytic murein transglycosylase-like protein
LRLQPNAKLAAPSTGFQFLAPLTPLAEGDCAPLETDYVESLIDKAARKHGLSAPLLRAVMRQESAFKPCAVSPRGAQGLMQLMPATAMLMRVDDPFDPDQNVEAGAAFLKQLLGRYKGDLRSALVAYNAGTLHADNPDPAQFPLETQGYLANIFAELDEATNAP